MHHHLFPSEDTYISKTTGYEEKNFGIDELLQIGTEGENVKTQALTKVFSYNNTVWSLYCVTDFTGIFIGTLETATVSDSTGSLSGSFSGTASYFTGSISGSYNGYINGIYSTLTNYSGSLGNFSGSFSSSLVIGALTGSFTATEATLFSGSLTGSSGIFTGLATGTDTVNIVHWVVQSVKDVDRTLIKFNLDTISASVSNGSIPNPQFHLHLKVCNEYQLPISYDIYAFPVSQSWDMGNGYYADGGSDIGANWFYRNYPSGAAWTYPFTSSTPRPVVDFFNTASNSSASFNYGGGTWYYNSSSKQSFSYEASDIDMDVTNIVLAWLSGSLPNNGFILMSSDEIESSGSGFTLTFFSKDTNSINSPYLDVMWDDSQMVTGSVSTASVNITSSYSGMQVTIQSGSTFTIGGGITGVFTASTFLNFGLHYVTASNVTVTVGTITGLTGSYSGSLATNLANVSGSTTGRGVFTASFFSGSVDGGLIFESPNAAISGSNVVSVISGSLISASLDAYSGSITVSSAVLTGIIGSGYYNDTVYYWMGGIVNGMGITGSISGLPVVGPIDGIVSINPTLVTGPCGKSFYAQLATASFIGGLFSGSSFTAYYVDYQFENAIITGSWTPAALLGIGVTIPIPSGIDPYAYAYVNGVYIHGRALGLYQTTQSNGTGSVAWDSASFVGQFVDGPLVGGYLNLQLSGSIYTSSYAYTSSVNMTASALSPLDTMRSFTVVVQNLDPAYKGGDMPRINVFARKEFPLKTYEKAAQQIEYLVPNYLPTSSYYAIKDNMSEEMIVDFDNYTRISCDATGNYFILNTTGLAQERPYRVLIRVEASGSKYTFDNGNVFKVTR